MDDDVMPNEAAPYFLPQEPSDQKIERKKERAQTLEALSVLKDLLARLDEKIAFYENINSIPDDVRVEPEKFLIMHNTHTLVARTLIQEREFIAGLLDTNAPNR